MNTTYPTIKYISALLLVADLAASLDFYTQMLGFEIDFRYEDFYAGIAKDGYRIHLKSGDPAINERTKRRFNEDLDLVFSVGAIHNLFEAMQNRRVNIVKPLREMPYGNEFYIADPNGYLLGFIE